MTPETIAEIQALRAKALAGTMTQEEMRRAVEVLREGRVMAAKTSAKASSTRSAAKAKKDINSDDLLSELDGL